MGKYKKKKRHSDALDALSAMGSEQEPAQQQPPPAEPSPQQPADQQQDVPAPSPRPEQPTPAAQEPNVEPPLPIIPKVPQRAGPPHAAKARTPATRRRPGAGRRPTARRSAARRQPPKPMDVASYNYKQTMIPVLLIMGVLILILATVLAFNLPADVATDPTHMIMPPHPMLANAATKWLVLAMFPVGAGLLFGAFMFVLQTQKQPPPEDQPVKGPRRYDRSKQTRRR